MCLKRKPVFIYKVVRRVDGVFTALYRRIYKESWDENPAKYTLNKWAKKLDPHEGIAAFTNLKTAKLFQYKYKKIYREEAVYVLKCKYKNFECFGIGTDYSLPNNIYVGSIYPIKVIK
jgi:hypothetical protein